MSSGLRTRQLDHLYESLSPMERDELLRVMLHAATMSGDTVIQRLEECLASLGGLQPADESTVDSDHLPSPDGPIGAQGPSQVPDDRSTIIRQESV